MITIDNFIKQHMNCRLAISIIRDVNVKGTPSSLAHEFNRIQEEVTETFNVGTLANVPHIISVRSMYKKLRIDPSRYSPSSETLVSRVLQNRGLYFINSAVDVNNYCSLKFLLPFGLYDYDKIVGNIKYRIVEDLEYENIPGNILSTDNKPFLIDDKGVIGSSTSDSRRTAVNLATRNLLSVVYADEEISEKDLLKILDFSSNMFVRYNDGKVTTKHIIY